LALAALLAVLTFVLPEDNMMFMVGDTNVPIAPVIILGILGLALLVTARRRGKEETTQEEPPAIIQDPEKVALNKRLVLVAWGFFLIFLVGFIVASIFGYHDLVNNIFGSIGIWSIGVGAILLGLNLTRYFFKIKMSGFTTILGILALISGFAQLFGLVAYEWIFLLILLAAYLILRPWLNKMQLFGKAEES
jgi:hypothetical protein